MFWNWGKVISKKPTIENISEDIKELKQLQDLSSIENIIVMISFAILILGINIYLNPNVNAFWKLAALTLIIFAIYPVILFFGTFLSKDIGQRVNTLETIIFVATSHIIGFGTITLIILLLTNELIQKITYLLDISNPVPIVVLIIFELWCIYFYYWHYQFIPYLEKERFSLLMKPIEIEHKIAKSFLLLFRKICNWLFRKNFLYVTFIFYIFILYCCIYLQEYFQFIMIIIIAIGNSYLILKHMNKVKKKRKKVGS